MFQQQVETNWNWHTLRSMASTTWIWHPWHACGRFKYLQVKVAWVSWKVFGTELGFCGKGRLVTNQEKNMQNWSNFFLVNPSRFHVIHRIGKKVMIFMIWVFIHGDHCLMSGCFFGGGGKRGVGSSFSKGGMPNFTNFASISRVHPGRRPVDPTRMPVLSRFFFCGSGIPS